MQLFKFSVAPAAFWLAGSLAGHSAHAEDLLGFSNYLFGANREDVARLSNGTAVNMSDGSMTIGPIEFNGIKDTFFSFRFDQTPGGETADHRFRNTVAGGKLTAINLGGTNLQQTCADFLPDVRGPLVAKYGTFTEKSEQQEVDRNVSQGPRVIVDDPHFLMNYKLTKLFDNNTYIAAQFKSVTYSTHGCQWVVSYAVRPAPTPPPPKLPPQGF